jgi:endonuclease/exonuclease/phosphatase family metal-dependent hydrolase
VRRHRPDLVALQEIDSRHNAAGETMAFEFLADVLGRHSAEVRLIAAPDGDYGHAVFSRWPMKDRRQHDISLAGREPRAAIECTIETPQGELHVIAAHLGLSIRERHRQAQVLSSLTQSGPGKTLVLGDFNDWIWRGSVQRMLARLLPQRSHQRTFPARLPLLSLDRIYARPSGLIKTTWTDSSAATISDHLPVVADLDLSVQSSETA